MKWVLHVVCEDGTTQDVPLSGETIRIGRHSDNTVVLKDLYVSRHHAELREDSQGLLLVDLGSKSGTFLNSSPVTFPERVNPGDEILTGRTTMRVVDKEQGSVSKSPAPDETVIFVDASPSSGSIQTRRISDSPEFSLMRIVVEAAREIAIHRSAKEFQPKLLSLALEATGAERGVIATFSGTGELIVQTMLGAWPDDQVTISRYVLGRARDEAEAVIAADIPSDDRLKDAGTIISAGLRSVLCTPLGTARPARGILYLDSRTTQAVFEPSHFDVVTTLAGMIDMGMENEDARVALREKERAEEELQTAKTIMQRLVPTTAPEAPEGFTLAGSLEACLTIGGDFFSFFPYDGNSYGMALADVAGKGLSAALLVANFHAVWAHLRASDAPLEQWLGLLNEELTPYMPENRFITLAFGVIDPDREELFFASAGHNPGLILRSDGSVEELTPLGPVLGLMAGMTFRSRRLPFMPGDRILLNSDGVTDQFDPSGEEYGQERLNALVQAHGSEQTPALLETILDSLTTFAGDARQMDDITVTILGRS